MGAVTAAGRAALHTQLVAAGDLLSIREHKNVNENRVLTSKYVVRLGVALAVDDKPCCSPLWYFTAVALCSLG